MNKQTLPSHTSLLYILVYLLISSCVNHIDEDEPAQIPAMLTVITRSTFSLPYPLQLYAFDASTKQLAAQTTVADESAGSSLSLSEGNYHLVALAGTQDCSFPNTTSLNNVISLPETNYARHALMTGSADVTINGDATAEIRMSYSMASISITLTDIPENIAAVSLLLSPLYNTMTFAGDYAGSKTVAIACNKENGVWKANTFYTFPANGQKVTLSIEMTDNSNQKQTYGYTYNGTLAANTPYNLSGSYKKGFTVNGNITADGWNKAENINFTFGTESDSGSGDDSGSDSEDTDDNYTVDAIPTARNMWNGHYIAAIQNKTATGADLLLLSLQEWKDVASANTKKAERVIEAADYAKDYTEGGITGWSIPTTGEAKLIKSNCGGSLLNAANALLTDAGGDALTGSDKDTHGNDVRYLCEDATYSYELKGVTGNITQAGGTRTYYLRVVKIVHVVLA